MLLLLFWCPLGPQCAYKWTLRWFGVWTCTSRICPREDARHHRKVIWSQDEGRACSSYVWPRGSAKPPQSAPCLLKWISSFLKQAVKIFQQTKQASLRSLFRSSFQPLKGMRNMCGRQNTIPSTHIQKFWFSTNMPPARLEADWVWSLAPHIQGLLSPSRSIPEHRARHKSRAPPGVTPRHKVRRSPRELLGVTHWNNSWKTPFLKKTFQNTLVQHKPHCMLLTGLHFLLL